MLRSRVLVKWLQRGWVTAIAEHWEHWNEAVPWMWGWRKVMEWICCMTSADYLNSHVAKSSISLGLYMMVSLVAYWMWKLQLTMHKPKEWSECYLQLCSSKTLSGWAEKQAPRINEAGLIGAHKDSSNNRGPYKAWPRSSVYALQLCGLVFLCQPVGVGNSLTFLPALGTLFFLLGYLVQLWYEGICLVLS